jgi:hypothetical protein
MPDLRLRSSMRIIIMTEFFPATDAGEITGGIEASCFYLSKYLRQRGHQVTVLALRGSGLRSLRSRDESPFCFVSLLRGCALAGT